MDFFARQAATRRLSRWLVALFVIAVIVVVVAVNAVVLTVVATVGPESPDLLAPGVVVPDGRWLSQHPVAVLFTTLAVLGVIGIASLYKSSALGAGGSVVARSLGGEPVAADTTDPLRRRLLNVVEEMAIASGVPVPEVYVLEHETGINAFAAGHNPANAAVAVTRGALVNLDRDELQGVIAHEFSHILNGDMRLNTRLIGLLFGLLVVAIIARMVLRHVPRGGGGRKGGGALAAIVLAALAIMILGYVGLFFGRLIQAAVSRSRESLADASAVQFTRDPGGLRGALVKIGALTSGSRLVDADAEEVAHMLFAPGVRRLLGTHPPLVERIRAIDPQFEPAEFERVRAQMLAAVSRREPQAEPPAQPAAARRLRDLLGASVVVAPDTVARLVGNPGTAHVRLAEEIRISLPPGTASALERPDQAAALLLALALDEAGEARIAQLELIKSELGEAIRDAVTDWLPVVHALVPAQRMPMLLQLFPALHRLGQRERRRLLDALGGLLRRDDRMSVYSYALHKLAQVQLRDDLEPRARFRQLTLDAAHGDLQVVFSVLARNGHDDHAAALRAYEAGMQHLLPRHRPYYAPPQNWPALLDKALDRLDRLMPAAKELVVEALLRTISTDLRMTVEESELLRAICASLHCPLPPLMTDAALAADQF